MSAPTVVRSAYPVPVAELVPRARELAAELDGPPSRNRLMKDLRIGADKAKAVLAELDAPPAEAARTEAPRPPAEAAPSVAPPVERPGVEVEDRAAPPASPVTVPAVAPVARGRRVRSWPVLLLAAPAFVAIWSGWVGLGGLTGFGVVHPLPGIADGFSLNTAITLPIGVETYAAYALRVWLSGAVPAAARRFAKWSAIGALILGALGQVAYHLMSAADLASAPWPITTVVACLPVAVLGMGAALAHLIHHDTKEEVRS